MKFGNFELDLGTRVLRKNGEPIPLTTGEFAVLKAFAGSLDVQVSRLRKLIEPEPSKPRYLQTVWGLGYVFIPDGHTV